MTQLIKTFSLVFLLASLVACGGGGGGDSDSGDTGTSGSSGSSGSGSSGGAATGGGTNVTTKTFAITLNEISVLRTVNGEAVNVDIDGIASSGLTLD